MVKTKKVRRYITSLVGDLPLRGASIGGRPRAIGTYVTQFICESCQRCKKKFQPSFKALGGLRGGGVDVLGLNEMDPLYLNLLQQLLPLYAIAVLGYIVGKLAKIDVKSITTLTIFVISPMVFMLSISKLDFSAGAIISPIIMFALACFFGFLTLVITRLYLEPKTAYLAALTTGTNNWGYFGIPIAFALFPPEMVAAYIVTGVSFQFFENSLGMYYISRGNKGPWESFLNIFKYPVIYAILIGILLSAFHVQLPPVADNVLGLFKGAYTVLGMMIIGLGLSQIDKFKIDMPFMATMFGVRFIMWPLVAMGIIYADQHWLHLLGETFYKPILLFSIVPMGANNIAFATHFDMHPAKAAMGVLFTTLFALVYVPVAIKLLGIG
ncbi:MAG: hypothetical protein GC136_06450 [Alphaproteobacteria bacterium]|nr:hypothetical protein [Alphaproteobacteria bacterium]